MLPAPAINNFTVGPLTIHFYGLIIATAILICYKLAQKSFIQAQLSLNLLDKIVFIIIPAALLGARTYHVLTNWSYYSKFPHLIPAIWTGGIGIQGGIIAGSLALFILSRKYHIPMLQLTDIFTPLLALGQAIGRWGNYFNQELYGKPTDLPWALYVDPQHRLPGYETHKTFHPLFLYESILNLLNFLLLFNLTRIQNSLKTPFLIRKALHGLTPTSLYLINYGLLRLAIESVKLDPDLNTLYATLRIPQWFSILFILIGITLIILQRHRSSHLLTQNS